MATANGSLIDNPDTDDDGEIDVEWYPVPMTINSGDAYLDRIWAKAAEQLNDESETED